MPRAKDFGGTSIQTGFKFKGIALKANPHQPLRPWFRLS